MIFSLYDIKAEVFGPLFEARTQDEAKRLFMGVILSDGDNNVCRYPQDHQLFCIGDYDYKTGIVEGLAPNMIMTGFEACQLYSKHAKTCSEMFTEKEVKKPKRKKGGKKNVDGNENSSSD